MLKSIHTQTHNYKCFLITELENHRVMHLWDFFLLYPSFILISASKAKGK